VYVKKYASFHSKISQASGMIESFVFLFDRPLPRKSFRGEKTFKKYLTSFGPCRFKLTSKIVAFSSTKRSAIQSSLVIFVNK
jgi:hypothetical protein